MTYTTSTPITGTSRGDPAKIAAWAKASGCARPDDVAAYLDTLYRICRSIGLSAHVLVAQSIHETADPDTGAPWASYWWRQRLNPAGIGINGDPVQEAASRTFADGAAAARAHVLHMYLYAVGTDIPTGLSKQDDPRWQAAVDAGRAGIARTIADLTGMWGKDPQYAKGVAKWLNALDDAGLLTAPSGDTTVPTTTPTKPTSPPIEQAYKAYTVPGGKRSLLLPSWIKVQIKPVDLEGVRSYTKSGPKTMTTVHDTGNPRTNAQAEYEWLAAGRPGGVVGGYEWITDDTGVIITGWFDEDTWAQGVANGNRISHAGEMAFGGNVVWTTALEVTCAMHGAVLEMEDRISEAAAVLHQWWTDKWCAGQILNRGIWPQVLAKIISYAKAARAFRLGQPVIDVPGTVYTPKSLPIDPATGKAWDGKADLTVNGVKFEAQKVTAKTTGALNQRQWATSESLTTGPMLDAGTSVDLLGWVAGELVDGISEWWVRADGARLWAGGIDAEPKTDPDYGQEPETHPGLAVVNGRTYYVLNHEQTGEQGREITIHRDGDLHRWADVDSALTGSLKEGDVVNCGWWTRGTELPLELTNYDGATVTVQEPIWYIVGNDLDAGNRFWSGLSTERPD